jgi:hypothetical protein
MASCDGTRNRIFPSLDDELRGLTALESHVRSRPTCHEAVAEEARSLHEP